MSKYFNGDKLSGYEDSPITYVYGRCEQCKDCGTGYNYNDLVFRPQNGTIIDPNKIVDNGTAIHLTCDNCGREIFGCTFVNGMKFCAKCYQEIFGNEQKYIDMMHKESSELLVNSLAEKDKKIAELQKQLEEKEKMLEEYKKCNCKECMTDYEKNLNQIIDKYLYENNSLKQQLNAQPAEIIDEIKKQMDARKLEYISHLTKKHCYGLRIDRIFEILDDILKEYQKGEN